MSRQQSLGQKRASAAWDCVDNAKRKPMLLSMVNWHAAHLRIFSPMVWDRHSLSGTRKVKASNIKRICWTMCPAG